MSLLHDPNTSLKEEAAVTLETLLETYNIEAIHEDSAKIFFGIYLLLYVKWFAEFLLIAFLFIFTGVFLWKWTPEGFELTRALKVVLECGLYCSYRYVWDQSFDKHAADATRKFVALVKRRPQDFRFHKEDTENGNKGNADQTE